MNQPIVFLSTYERTIGFSDRKFLSLNQLDLYHFVKKIILNEQKTIKVNL